MTELHCSGVHRASASWGAGGGWGDLPVQGLQEAGRDLRRAGGRRPDSIQDWLNQYLKYAFIHEYNETTA